jgi:NADH-quinone oxidoreductase subunit K
MTPTLNAYLMVAGLLFTLGFLGVMVRRNTLFVYMCLELMLAASSLVFVAFSRYNQVMDGALFVFFIITVAAAEIAVGLAIIVGLYRKIGTIQMDKMNRLKG